MKSDKFKVSINHLLILFASIILCGVALSQSLPTVGIYPMDAEGVDNVTLNSFADRLEDRFIASRKFTVVTRTRIEQVIEEQNLIATCSANECAIELGRIVGANIIVGKISGLGAKSYHVSAKLLDKETAEILASFSEVYEGTKEDLRKQYPDVVAKDIIRQLTAAVLRIEGDPPKAMVKFDDIIIGRLPIPRYLVDPGLHTITVEQIGFDEWKQKYYFTEKEEYYRFIELTPKTKKSALIKSLILPGWGQLYSSDEQRLIKKVLGYSFFIAEVSLIGGSYFVYSDYLDKKSKYDNAHTDYYNEKGSSTTIENKRKIMLNKYKSMEDAFDLFKILSFTTAGLWIGNALEAYLNFPEYADINIGYHPNNLGYVYSSTERVRIGVSFEF